MVISHLFWAFSSWFSAQNALTSNSTAQCCTHTRTHIFQTWMCKQVTYGFMFLLLCLPSPRLTELAAEPQNTEDYPETKIKHTIIYHAQNTHRYSLRAWWVSTQTPPDLEEEGIRVISELAQDLLLEFGVDAAFFILERRINLSRAKEDVPAEGHSQHVHIITSIAKRTG